MHRLWLLVGSFLTVAALGFATFNVVSVMAHEEMTVDATFPAAGLSSVRLDTESGRVEIVGDDVEEITLVAEISHGIRRTGHEATVDGDTLVVRSDCPTLPTVWCRVAYRLVVPGDLASDVHTDDGRLILRDLRGDVRADGDSGSVVLARLSGDVDASTDDGSVRATGLGGATVAARSTHGAVRLSFADAPTAVTARTSDGAVEVVVPDDDATYRVDVDNFVGSTDTAIRIDPGSDRSITATTDNGSVTVRYPTG
ncbi:MAG: hypothetical protein WKF43_06615 [Acidimicrobiales bacterium]